MAPAYHLRPDLVLLEEGPFADSASKRKNEWKISVKQVRMLPAYYSKPDVALLERGLPLLTLQARGYKSAAMRLCPHTRLTRCKRRVKTKCQRSLPAQQKTAVSLKRCFCNDMDANRLTLVPFLAPALSSRPSNVCPLSGSSECRPSPRALGFPRGCK